MHLLNHRLGRITALLALGSVAALAQGTQTANMNGEVAEKGGAAIAGATVRLTSPSLQGVRTHVTDANGKFVARLLPPGAYTVEIVKEGMQTVKQSVTLGIDQTWNAKFVMAKVSGAVVEVIAATPAIDKTDAKTATNINFETLDRLPQGRTIEGAALMTPGVVQGVGGRLQVRGAQTSSNLYLVDGQNVADNAYNNRGVRMISDSIEETQTITGAISAEYGNVGGGVINTITKSGGNEFTGQIRWELTNPAWNARTPSGYRVVSGAVVPSLAQSLDNKLGDTKTFTVGGYILKDRLWFFTSYFQTETSTPRQIGGTTGGPGGAGTDYTYTIKEIRRQIKLTWAINQNHTLTLAGSNSENAEQNRDYSAGETLALIPQGYKDYYWNLNLRSVFSANLTMDAKIGGKHQKYSAGNVDNGEAPIYSYSRGRFFNQGIFNSLDGGDNRDNRTANVKFSYFWDAAGSHQTDAGIDYYKGTSRARNDQSPHAIDYAPFGATGPTNRSIIFGTTGTPNLTTRTTGTGRPVDLWTFITGTGEATSESYGFYLNDKWQVDNHLNVQIGARFDTYKAENESGSKTAGANGFSPRLGLKYDLFGDSKWIFGVSYARYNEKVLEAITNSVTKQGNPTEIDYAYAGPTGTNIPYTTVQNLANYDLTPAGITYFNDPTVNVRLNDKLKAPKVDEYQASAAWSFSPMADAKAFLRLTAAYRKWSDLIDYFSGQDGQVTAYVGSAPIGDFYVRRWDNQPLAKRYYRDLELDGGFQRGPWDVTGNITWSKLEGNYEGEGTSSPGRGEGLSNFTYLNGAFLYDNNITAPRGYLSGHVPVRAQSFINYVSDNTYGKTTYGIIYRFTAGSHYSTTRIISPDMLNPLVPSDYGTTATQYLNNRRGTGVFAAFSTVDLAINHEWPLFKVAGRAITAFGKVAITNVFNHQQKVSWDTAMADAPTGLGDPWVPNNLTYNLPTSVNNFVTARTYAVSAGVRF